MASVNCRLDHEQLNPLFHARGIFSGTIEAPASSISEAKVQIKCWPNPAHQQLWVDGVVSGSAFEIVNMKGQRIQSGKMKSIPGCIPLEGLPAGRYLIRWLDSETRSSSLSFIKQQQ